MTLKNNTQLKNLYQGMKNEGTADVSLTTFDNCQDTTSLGGGIGNYGTLDLRDSTFKNCRGDLGGCLYVSKSATPIPETKVHRCLFRESRANAGGAIYIKQFCNVKLCNSTITCNICLNGGGGGIHVFNGSQVTLVIDSCTIVYNWQKGAGTARGGGIYINTAGCAVRICNTIISLNVSDADPTTKDVYGPYCDCNGTGCTTTVGSSNWITLDPVIGPLQDKGGPTLVHPLKPGSPCIDAGNTDLTVDQRGFPRFTGVQDDIGAYEGSDGTGVGQGCTAPSG